MAVKRFGSFMRNLLEAQPLGIFQEKYIVLILVEDRWTTETYQAIVSSSLEMGTLQNH